MEEAKEPLIKPRDTKRKLRIMSYFLLSFFFVLLVIDYFRIKEREISSIVLAREFSILFAASLGLKLNIKYFGQSFYTLLIISMIALLVAFIDDIFNFFDALKNSEKPIVIIVYSVLIFLDIVSYVVLGIAENTYRQRINFKLAKAKKN